MFPSKALRRAGTVSAATLALALSGNAVASASLITDVLKCPLPKLYDTATGQCVDPTASVPTVPAPTPTLPSVPLPTSPSSGGSSGGGSIQLPQGPGLPSLPGVQLPGGGSGGGGVLPGGGGGSSTPGLPGSGTGSTPGGSGPSASSDPSTVPGADGGSSAMLGAASAYLPTSDILSASSFGTGGSGSSTSLNNASVPSPELAGPSQLAAVQAPLLAAGEEAGKGGTVLTALTGSALPGLLVVLATALVAAVGAGNVRIWQARMAARQAQRAA